MLTGQAPVEMQKNHQEQSLPILVKYQGLGRLRFAISQPFPHNRSGNIYKRATTIMESPLKDRPLRNPGQSNKKGSVAFVPGSVILAKSYLSKRGVG